MVIEGLFNLRYGAAGQQYNVPPQLTGGVNLGFMFLPIYRAWVIVAAIVVCFSTWYAIERTKLGAYLRAATENPDLVRAFGINVPRMLMLTYAFGVGLAGFAGVMAAPIYQVSPQMGQSVIVTIFAVVVIGGMGSIFGAIFSGLALGVIEGLTKVFYPAGLDNRDLRHHGRRAGAASGGSPWTRDERPYGQRPVVGAHRLHSGERDASGWSCSLLVAQRYPSSSIRSSR